MGDACSGVCAFDSPGCSRHGALPHVDSGECGEQDHAAGAIVLPEIRVVWNAGSLRWIARPDETECSFSGLSANLERANFFYAKVLRADGNYEGAATRLRMVLVQYPRDRVAINDLGRVLFLQRKYDDSVKILQSVLAIDPEDLQAHYNLMLCYNGLGQEKLAQEHQARYMRFKADESSQSITGPYRQAHPEDNNERQAVHEHMSVPLPALGKLQKPKIVARR